MTPSLWKTFAWLAAGTASIVLFVCGFHTVNTAEERLNVRFANRSFSLGYAAKWFRAPRIYEVNDRTQQLIVSVVVGINKGFDAPVRADFPLTFDRVVATDLVDTPTLRIADDHYAVLLIPSSSRFSDYALGTMPSTHDDPETIMGESAGPSVTGIAMMMIGIIGAIACLLMCVVCLCCVRQECLHSQPTA